MKKVKFSNIRGGISQYARLASRINFVSMETEIVVDNLKTFCTEHNISYTAVLMKIIAAAKQQNPVINAVAPDRVFGKKTFIPESVDIALAIEKTYGTETFVTTPVVRSVEKKTITEITSEIALLVSTPFNKLPGMREMSVFYLLPDFFKYLVLKCILKSSFLCRTYFGTIGVSSLGKFEVTGFYPTVWVTSMVLGISRIHKKAVVEDNKIINRDVICVDVCFNPSVIDYITAGKTAKFIKNTTEQQNYYQLL